MSDEHLETHDFGEHLVKFEKGMEHHLHHLASLKPQERRDLFHEAKTSGDAYYSPRPGVHLVLKRNHDGTYILGKH
ncbi:MAG: hypothetical protein M1275_01770 [Patescibacteria group bacterium]|nr:hypothetical protein [Patescibacteria group bacterium]